MFLYRENSTIPDSLSSTQMPKVKLINVKCTYIQTHVNKLGTIGVGLHLGAAEMSWVRLPGILQTSARLLHYQLCAVSLSFGQDKAVQHVSINQLATSHQTTMMGTWEGYEQLNMISIVCINLGYRFSKLQRSCLVSEKCTHSLSFTTFINKMRHSKISIPTFK